MQKIDSIEKLEAVYSTPVGERSIWKEIDHVNELYRKFIEASPFLILATCGDNGVDCSPRGDPPALCAWLRPIAFRFRIEGATIGSIRCAI